MSAQSHLRIGPLASSVACLLAAVLTQAAMARACGVVAIPSMFSAGRSFATPVAAADGRSLFFWVDSDGSGFEFDDVARRYATLSPALGNSAPRASLPAFSSRGAIPGLAASGATLPVLRRSDVAGDALFAGLAGQLGASWLEHRVWTFDYPHAAIVWRCDASDPPHERAEEIALSFALDDHGRLEGGAQYPQLRVHIDGADLLASVDTAASVSLSTRAKAAMHDSVPAVRATSFATQALVRLWHARHPQWTYIPDAGSEQGVAAILVPTVTAGQVRFSGVWFTTRPSDDVFSGERESLKLGPSAFGRNMLTLDYRRRIAIVGR